MNGKGIVLAGSDVIPYLIGPISQRAEKDLSTTMQKTRDTKSLGGQKNFGYTLKNLYTELEFINLIQVEYSSLHGYIY